MVGTDEGRNGVILAIVTIAILLLGLGGAFRQAYKSSVMRHICQSHGYATGEWTPMAGNRCIAYVHLGLEEIR
jgi:hypothetical protein